MPRRVGKQGAKIRTNVKLYLQRLVVSDDYDELMPDWTSFIYGVVDSEDLPLLITLNEEQQSKYLRAVRKNLVNKCLDMFEEAAEKTNDYKKSYQQSIKMSRLVCERLRTSPWKNTQLSTRQAQVISKIITL